MANTCYTNIYVTGPDTKEFYGYLKSCDGLHKCGFEHWLGDFLLGLGLPLDVVSDGTKCGINCRGSWIPEMTVRMLGDSGYEGYDGPEGDCDSVHIYTESVGSACADVFELVKLALGLDVKIQYEAEEDGCGYYVASDTDILEGGSVYASCLDDGSQLGDSLSESLGGDGYYKADDVKAALRGFIQEGFGGVLPEGLDADSLDALIEEAESLDEDSDASFEAYEIDPAESLDGELVKFLEENGITPGRALG